MEHPLSGFRFTEQIRVRYAEVDAQGIVFHAHYLTYLDVTLTEYFRNLGFTLDAEGVAQSGFEMVLVRSEQQYIAPARYDDVLTIGMRITQIGNSSFTAQFRIVRGEGELVLDAQTTYVNFDRNTGAAVPIPPAVRERINNFEQGA